VVLTIPDLEKTVPTHYGFPEGYCCRLWALECFSFHNKLMLSLAKRHHLHGYG